MGLFSIFKKKKKEEPKPQRERAPLWVTPPTEEKPLAKPVTNSPTAQNQAPTTVTKPTQTQAPKASPTGATTPIAKQTPAVPAKPAPKTTPAPAAKPAPKTTPAPAAKPAPKPATKTVAKPAPKAAPNAEEKPQVKTAVGKFEIKKSKDSRFVFNLYAANKVIVATSQVYSSSTAALNGIKSVIENAEKAPIEDQTLRSYDTLSYPKWEIYLDKGNQYRFRLNASNGSCICHSQGYTSKASCKNGIESIRKTAKTAVIDKSYLNKD